MKWKIKESPSSEKILNLEKELNIDKTLAKILVQRGITNFNEAKAFFRPSLKNLHDPFLMKDMDYAVKRIEKAIQKQENILIYGDYDVDGTTAVSLLYLYLKTIHHNISFYIPDRYDEGYGISYKGIDFASDNNFSLIIALDCGIKAIEKVDYASNKNIDFIICDHHKPGDIIPRATAVLNPKRIDCKYPYKELCGCGVGFKLIQALHTKRNNTIDSIIPYLDLVAIAIAADIVPITGENRVLTHFGLKMINSNPRAGVEAIINETKREILTINDVVFGIAPRINAAGRIKHGNYAVELLTQDKLADASNIAKEIEIFNSERKNLDATITTEALNQIKENNELDKFTTVVYHENWHKGVIGIVASRLIEQHYRPTLVFTKSGNKLAASARSVSGFDIYNALEQCSEHIEQFGGHKYAAGLTLLPEKYQDFKKTFEEVVKKSITEDSLTPEIIIDSELELTNITPKFFRILKQLAPFGPQNKRPVFKTSDISDTGHAKQVGADKSHLKLSIYQKEKANFIGAIGFGLGDKLNLTKDRFEIAYSLDENNWNGEKSIQLILKDIK